MVEKCEKQRNKGRNKQRKKALKMSVKNFKERKNG